MSYLFNGKKKNKTNNQNNLINYLNKNVETSSNLINIKSGHSLYYFLLLFH